MSFFTQLLAGCTALVFLLGLIVWVASPVLF